METSFWRVAIRELKKNKEERVRNPRTHLLSSRHRRQSGQMKRRLFPFWALSSQVTILFEMQARARDNYEVGPICQVLIGLEKVVPKNQAYSDVTTRGFLFPLNVFPLVCVRV